MVHKFVDFGRSERFWNKGYTDIQKRREKIMSDLKTQEKLTDGKGWKGIYKAITPSKKLKDKVTKIAKPFVDESVLIPTTVKKVKEKIQKIKDKK